MRSFPFMENTSTQGSVRTIMSVGVVDEKLFEEQSLFNSIMWNCILIRLDWIQLSWNPYELHLYDLQLCVNGDLSIDRTESCLFTLLSVLVAVTISGIHCAFPLRDGQAELAWVV